MAHETTEHPYVITLLAALREVRELATWHTNQPPNVDILAVRLVDIREIAARHVKD
jgi:hypothetical protein